MEMPIVKDVVLALLFGTVAANVHWIVLPLTLPFTLLTFSWRANTDDEEDSEFSMVYLYSKYLNIIEMMMSHVCLGIVLHTVLTVQLQNRKKVQT